MCTLMVGFAFSSNIKSKMTQTYAGNKGKERSSRRSFPAGMIYCRYIWLYTLLTASA